jgi:uncharacterized protein (DUF4415 family)
MRKDRAAAAAWHARYDAQVGVPILGYGFDGVQSRRKGARQPKLGLTKTGVQLKLAFEVLQWWKACGQIWG